MRKFVSVKFIVIFLLSISFLMLTYLFIYKKSPITLIQAYELSYSEAIKWDKNATLYLLTSVDNPRSKNYKEGFDGKRKNWNAAYVIPNTNKNIIITIHNKKIKSINYLDNAFDNNNLVYKNNVKMDSIDALELAKRNFKLCPGKEWAIGYHYMLFNTDNKTIITLVCRDEFNNPIKINIDANHQEIIDF